MSVTDTNPKQTVYVFKCVKCTLKVSGKVNSIILGEYLCVWTCLYVFVCLFVCLLGCLLHIGVCHDVCVCVCVDNCKRVAVCFDDVISSVEVINSQSIQVQVNSSPSCSLSHSSVWSSLNDVLFSVVQMMGKCPTVSIDKTDGCQVYLSKASVKCEIITAKSSEMNICIPPPPGKQDFVRAINRVGGTGRSVGGACSSVESVSV